MISRRFDLPLLLLTLLLVASGLVMVWSASAFVAQEMADKDAFHYVKRQGLAVGIGALLLVLCAWIPYRRLVALAPQLYGGCIVALLCVWVPGLGHAAKGANRWFTLAGVNFQPAEMVKLVVLLGLAGWLDRNRGRVNEWKPVLLPAFVALALPLGLVAAQPDFGSTAIILMLVGIMVFNAGLRWSYILGLGAFGVAGLGALMVAEPYRVARLMSFLEPFSDCEGPGYQVCQSLTALHMGGLHGTGLGDGVAKLLYLPEPHNDFIAAVVGEELGLLGLLALLTSYGLFAWRGVVIARGAKDLLGTLLASTVTAMIVGQACLNLGVVMSVVPPKGLVLPFMSYGASAMMINLAAVGVLLSVSAEVMPQASPAGAPRAVPA
jgi:cell division protein FtsW